MLITKHRANSTVEFCVTKRMKLKLPHPSLCFEGCMKANNHRRASTHYVPGTFSNPLSHPGAEVYQQAVSW